MDFRTIISKIAETEHISLLKAEEMFSAAYQEFNGAPNANDVIPIVADSLMIKDWVYCFDPADHDCRQPFQISKIRYDDLDGVEIGFPDFNDWYPEGWFEPILLTIAMLKCNDAIEEDLYPDTYVFWEGSNRFSITYDVNRFVINGGIEVTYVHELQNWLHVRGLHKTAREFKIK